MRKTTQKSQKKGFNLWRAIRLIVCFPLGLYVMWTKSRWPVAIKAAITLTVVLLLAVILTPLTNPPERTAGGIRLVEAEPRSDVYGPEAPTDRDMVEIYAPRRTAVLVEATATPEPIIVYCNNGGRYYHSKDCRYVKPTTPKADLSQALKAGFSKCPYCNAPDPE